MVYNPVAFCSLSRYYTVVYCGACHAVTLAVKFRQLGGMDDSTKKSMKVTRSSGTKSKSNEQSSDVCFVCSKTVSDSDDGLQCEICDGWFHIKCVGVAKKTYDLLKDPTVTGVNWYCTPCNKGSKKILMSMTALEARQTDLELDVNKLKLEINAVKLATDSASKEFSKVGTTVSLIQDNLEQETSDRKKDIQELKQKLELCEKMVERKNTSVDAASDRPLWSDIISKSDAVDSKLADIVVEVQTLQKQTSGIQQDWAEQDEQNKRKNCVIFQGMKEPDGTTGEDRKKADIVNVTDLLHAINCDNVSVNSCFRLGKFPGDPVVKPRPVKLVLSSEAQKQQVLQSAKNLKGNSNGFAMVFIHQDLTPKQREVRQLLVKQLKERQAKGETNLLIVGDSIVKRRP